MPNEDVEHIQNSTELRKTWVFWENCSERRCFCNSLWEKNQLIFFFALHTVIHLNGNFLPLRSAVCLQLFSALPWGRNKAKELWMGENGCLKAYESVLWPQLITVFYRTRKLPCIFAALFVCYSSHLRLRDSLLRPCYDFLLFFTTQTRPVHRETDSGDEKFITPINKIHNPILCYAWFDK